ncbi:hypothetical protein BD410DRAFT_301488 [Rickenella mellea]|uniref:Uncharacterized protein n=1 Tax=Rickenella mellea TaxID=50990 RepID=A0A4Y7Q299_9AGAM|nr:hypothetical protein BD410DRAFT_301488 [Rickenella mellea]
MSLGSLPVIMGFLPILALGSAITAIPECQGLYPKEETIPAYDVQAVNCGLKFINFAKSDADPFPFVTGPVECIIGLSVVATTWNNVALAMLISKLKRDYVNTAVRIPVSYCNRCIVRCEAVYWAALIEVRMGNWWSDVQPHP